MSYLAPRPAHSIGHRVVFPPGVPKRLHLSRVLPDPKKEGGESARYSNVPEIMSQRSKVQQIQDDKRGQGTHNELWPLPPAATPLCVLWMQGCGVRPPEWSFDLCTANPAYCREIEDSVWSADISHHDLVGFARFFWRPTAMRWAITVQYKTTKR